MANSASTSSLAIRGAGLFEACVRKRVEGEYIDRGLKGTVLEL